MHGEIKLFSGSSHPDLARSVAEHLGGGLANLKLGRFSDGEIYAEIQESVRGKDVFVLQSLSSPVNDNLMELLVIVDALRRSSAGQITAVLPYYGYARQDRQATPRSAITARLVADLLLAAGIQRVITVDLHAGQIQGFFSTPLDHLYAQPILLGELRLRRIPPDELVIVAPDAGGVDRARRYSQRLGAPLAIIDKRRSGPNVAQVMHLIGDVKDRIAVIVDDMIDTAGTLTQGASAVLQHGAREVHAMATHAVFSGEAISRIEGSALKSVTVTDTIPPTARTLGCPKIKVLPIGPLLGDAIERVHGGRSISSLFQEHE
jgi:ribose-phosphate pyrophosphokinase